MHELKLNLIDSWSPIWRRPIRFADRFFRVLTSRWRHLPNALIVGAQKSGTSSLFDYLAQHPDVLTSAVKEVHFFDGGLEPTKDNYRKGIKWYRSFFPIVNRRDFGKVVLEASPLYLFNPDAPVRIRNELPAAKILIVLRNPVERALSHYFHEVRADRENRPLVTAIAEEDELLHRSRSSCDFNSYEFIRFSYRARGIYADQVSRYLKLFPRDQVLVITSKSLFERPDATIESILCFLDIDKRFVVPDKRPRNQGSSTAVIDPEATEMLNDFFEDHNKRLFSLLGRELDW